jgi:hypothetical protein
MNRLTRKLVRFLFGPAAVDGVTDEMIDGITLAIQQEAEAMGLNRCA